MSAIIKQLKPQNQITGFEGLDFSVFPDCESRIAIPFVHGKFDIGLDGKENEEKRKYFEKAFGVTFDSPDGEAFLNDHEIPIDHNLTILPKNPTNEFNLHLLKYHKGFGIVKMDEAHSGPIDSWIFELADDDKDREKRITQKQILFEAGANLNKMYEEDRARLLLVANYLLDTYNGAETESVAYDRMSEFIENYKNAALFIKTCKQDTDILDTHVTIKRAIALNIIRMVDGRYINVGTKNVLGKNFDEIVEFCLNPANQDEYGTGKTTDPSYTIKSLLKSSPR